MPPRKRDVAMVFQSYALYPHMTVEQNLTYSLRIRGAAKAEVHRARAAEVAAITGLTIFWSAIRVNSPAASASAWP